MSDDLTPINSFPTDETGRDDLWHKAKLDRDNQRKVQRGRLFWGIAIICIAFYIVFLWQIVCFDKTYQLLDKSQYSLFLFSLLGIIPTVLLLALMKSVYRSTKEASGMAGMADEIAKLISAVVQLIVKK